MLCSCPSITIVTRFSCGSFDSIESVDFLLNSLFLSTTVCNLEHLFKLIDIIDFVDCYLRFFGFRWRCIFVKTWPVDASSKFNYIRNNLIFCSSGTFFAFLRLLLEDFLSFFLLFVQFSISDFGFTHIIKSKVTDQTTIVC